MGIIVSAYLVFYHYEIRAGEQGWCNFSSFLNCNNVLKSIYSEFFGIPIGAFGAIWFLVVLALNFSDRLKLPRLIKENSKLLMVFWGVAGLSPVVFLIFVEFFVLNSICILCTADHILIVLVFILAVKNVMKE